MFDQFMTTVMPVIPWLLLSFIVWRYFDRLRIEREQKLHGHECYTAGQLRPGSCWIHKRSARAYTILWLTNVNADKPGWEIQVTYTHDYKYVYTRSLSEFCAKFFLFEYKSSEALDRGCQLAALHSMSRVGPDGILHIPAPGETWCKGTVRALYSDDSNKQLGQENIIEEAKILQLYALDTAQPIVLYSVNEKPTAILLFQFIDQFRKQDTEHGQAAA